MKTAPTFISRPKQVKTWAIDWDSTLASLMPHMCDTLAQTHGVVIAPSEINNWEWWSGHDYEHFVWGSECYQSSDWTLAMPPIRGAKGALHQLAQRGDRIVIVSDRPSHMKPWIEAWMANQGMSYPVVVTNKQRSKPEICLELGLRHTVDDSPHQVDSYQQSGAMERIFLFDQPYNQLVPDTDNTRRVKSWRHFSSLEPRTQT